MEKRVIYQIRIKGILDKRWSSELHGMAIVVEDDGNTCLTGPLPDQAALHGVLNIIRDLNLKLISVNYLDIY